EAHHAVTFDRDVRVREMDHDNFMRSILWNEAEAQSSAFEHFREAAARTGVDHGRKWFGFAEYHREYDRFLAARQDDARFAGLAPASREQLARQAGTARLMELVGAAVPSGSITIDPTTGVPVLKAGKPRNYVEK